jgi:dienelactone hydrolase
MRLKNPLKGWYIERRQVTSAWPPNSKSQKEMKMFWMLNQKSCSKLLFGVSFICLLSLGAFPSLGVGQKKNPQIDIEPGTALIDQQVTIKVLGLEPGQKLKLRASMRDNQDREWESWATFQANSSGLVNLAADKPIQGTYRGLDPAGMFWSMIKKTEGKSSGVEGEKELSPIVMHFIAEVDGKEIASASLERHFLAREVKRIEVREKGLLGTFFVPAGEVKKPAIIVLGGSGGGLQESKAALLASHGFDTLALAYFGMKGLPQYLLEIPLEYFDTALQWLNNQETVHKGKLGVTGASRGGELVLLLGATFPSIRAVAALVPSGIVHGAFPKEGFAWTYQGSSIPYAAFDMPPCVTSSSSAQRAISLTPDFLNGLLLGAFTKPDSVAPAIIPVEKINGPVLFISGKDDQMWPSSLLSEVSVARLKAYRHPFSFEHLCYEGAGHGIGIPYLPTTETAIKHPVDGGFYELGGSPEHNAAANADSWKKIVHFFEKSFKELK